MKMRFANGNKLPIGWHPGEPLADDTSVDLRVAQQCPFGPECYSCSKGLLWHAGFETHVNPPHADR